MMFLSLPRSNVVSRVTNISVMCHMSHISSHHNYTKHKLSPTCRIQSAWPRLGEEVIIGNSTEALGRQPRVWRSDYDVVIMKPNYVHIYLFSGASQTAAPISAKMETFPNITRMKWSHRSFKFGIPAIEISTQLNCHQNSLSISYEH